MARFQDQSPLRRALLIDAGVTAVTALAMAGGAPLLSGLLALPEPLLRYAGLSLVPFVALVAFVATRPQLSHTGVWAVIGLNALWVVASVALLLGGMVAPNALGYGFVLFQAAVVAVFAELQFLGLRRSTLRPAV
ncbi:MAG TPA: hypothetical protein VFS21_33720 [Roseiflexaceae bacterium]|nr:hypothetical protein [Roseiflexaceae bacterium]